LLKIAPETVGAHPMAGARRLQHLLFFQTAKAVGGDPRRQTSGDKHKADEERAEGDDEIERFLFGVHRNYSTRMRGSTKL